MDIIKVVFNKISKLSSICFDAHVTSLKPIMSIIAISINPKLSCNSTLKFLRQLLYSPSFIRIASLLIQEIRIMN